LTFFTFARLELGVGMKKILFSRADQGAFEILASADYIPIGYIPYLTLAGV
jgi:hypothetical protein